MGIGKFFAGVGNFMKNGGVKKLIDKGKAFVKKVVPKIKPVLQKGKEVAQNLPEYIDTGKKIYDTTKNITNNIVNTLPDGQTKDKINDAIKKIDDKANTVFDRGGKYADQIKRTSSSIFDGAEKMRGLFSEIGGNQNFRFVPGLKPISKAEKEAILNSWKSLRH